MTKVPADVRELPISERGLIAFKAAVKKAFEEHAREGLLIYVWRDVKIVEIPTRSTRSRISPLISPISIRSFHWCRLVRLRPDAYLFSKSRLASA